MDWMAELLPLNILAEYLIKSSLVLLAALVLWLLKRPWPPLALGGIASLGGIALAPAISPEAVAVPVMLLGLAAMEGVGEAASNDNGPTDTSL